MIMTLPSKVCFDEDRDDEEEEHERDPEIDDGPDGEGEARRGDEELVLVADVAHGGLEDGPHPGPGPGQGVEDGGEDEGEEGEQDQHDVEGGVRGGRHVAHCQGEYSWSTVISTLSEFWKMENV